MGVKMNKQDLRIEDGAELLLETANAWRKWKYGKTGQVHVKYDLSIFYG